MCVIIDNLWKGCLHKGLKSPFDLRPCGNPLCVGTTHQVEEVEGVCSDCIRRQKDHNPQATKDERERIAKKGKKEGKKHAK